MLLRAALLPQAPDGTTLCTCGRKKVLWYLSRGLAHVVAAEGQTAAAAAAQVCVDVMSCRVV